MRKGNGARIRVVGVVAVLALGGLVAAPAPAGADGVSIPPRSVRVAPGNARATIRWHKPASNGGHPITAYEIEVYHEQVSLGIYQFQSSATWRQRPASAAFDVS